MSSEKVRRPAPAIDMAIGNPARKLSLEVGTNHPLVHCMLILFDSNHWPFWHDAPGESWQSFVLWSGLMYKK